MLASAAALPVLLGTASCRSQDVFTGPDPLAGPPRPAPDVITLQAVIAAEQRMIQLYRAALGGNRAAARARSLEPLLAEHEQHLARLRACRICQPSPALSAQGRHVGGVGRCDAREQLREGGLRGTEPLH